VHDVIEREIASVSSVPKGSKMTAQELDKAEKLSQQLLAEVTSRYRTPQGIHVESVLGALAALAGDQALKASGALIPTTSWVLGGPADSIIHSADPKKSTLWVIIKTFAIGAGAEPRKLPDPFAVMTAADENIAISRRSAQGNAANCWVD
jgi:hypothetical protein